MSFLKHPPDSPDIQDDKTLPSSDDHLVGDHEKDAGAKVAITEPKAWQETPPEVKAVAAEVDDPEVMCETIRAYVVGTIVTVVATGLNVWFGSRQPGVYLSPYLAQFVAHPIGILFAKVLPRHTFSTFGIRWSLNPGPWTIKEHVMVSLMSTVALPGATAVDVIVVTKLPVFFDDPSLGSKYGFQFLLIIATQFLGFGLAGMAREILVYPPSMLWPTSLAKVSLFNALHRRHVDENGQVSVRADTERDPPVNGWTISGFKFALIVTGCGFVWFFVTSFLMPFFTYFNWPTWIAPTNAKLAIIMGSVSGLGLNPVPSFDWTFISGAGLTPLITPWFATLQTFFGCFVGFLIIVAIYFSNTWYTSYLLPNSNAAWDRFGLPYNITRVIDDDHTLNEAKYLDYSPIYYSAGYNVVFAAYFAQYTSAIVYALMDHWGKIKTAFKIGYRQIRGAVSRKHSTAEADELRRGMDYDVHYQLMQKYPEAPQWWFAIVLVISLVFGIVACEVYKTTMPVWLIILCFLMAAVFLIPAGIIYAVANVQLTLVVLAEIIPGVAIPGRPYANMIAKIFGWIALVQALVYALDQKLAHYMHIPPRATFRAQMWGNLLSCVVTIGIINWQMNVVPDLCEPGQKDLLTCPYYTTFYSSALLFGVLGPERVYGKNGLYKNILWSFLIGAGLTVIASLAKRRWRQRWVQAINMPVLISGAQYWAPYNMSFVWSGVPLAWTFMHYLYTRYHPWWNKYNYLLSIGLTVGTAIAAVIIFFCITYPGAKFAWWGTKVSFAGCDGLGCPLEVLPAAGYFGPGPGQFS